MPSSIAASVAGSVASAGISKLLGGKKSGRTLDIGTGGYTIKVDKYGNPFITPTKERTALVDSLSSKANQQASDIRGSIPGLNSAYQSGISSVDSALAGLKPGYGDITAARVNSIQTEGAKSASDLRGNLARRRVLGSSFGEDTISRDKAEFAKREADARAQSYLEELDKNMELVSKKLNWQTSQINDTNALISAAYDASKAADQYQLEEYQSQLNVLFSIMGSAQKVAETNAQADANKAASVGSIAGNIGSLVSGGLSASGLTGGYDPTTGITWNSGSY